MGIDQVLTTGALLNAITEGVLLVSPEGDIVDCNQVAATRLGVCAPADLIGKNAFKSIAPELAASRREVFDEVVRTGKPAQFEDVRGGRRILNSLSPVFVDGRVAQVAVLGYDVTEVADNAQALRESERWLSDSQRIAGLGHYTYDIRSRTWNGSPSCNEVLGTEGDHAADISRWLALVHPDDVDRLQRFFTDEVLGRRVPFDIEYRVIRPRDGATRWVHSLGRVEFDEDGRPLVMFGILHDVTERNRAREALLESEASLQAILQSTADGILAVDADGKMLFASDRFAELWRIPEDVMATRDDSALIKCVLDQLADPPGFLRMVQELYGSDRESHDVLEFKDGRVFERFSMPMVRKDGLRGRVWSFRDVTARRHAEAKLRQQATTDELTGVLNRRRFFELAQIETKRAVRHHEPLAVVFIDVDRLKNVNDRYGHAAGDKVLVTFAEICGQGIRDIDVFARMGGDEFALLLPSTTLEQARATVERIREGLEAMWDDDGDSIPVTISAGVAGLSRDDDTLDMLVKRADRALYQAKDAGRNRTAVHEGA